MTESIEELVLVPKSELDFLRNCLKNGSNTTPKESAMCENYNSNQENFKAEEGFEKNKAQKKEKKTQKKEKEILDNDLLDQCIKDSGILFDDCKMSEAYDDDNVDDEKMMTQDYNSQNEMKNQVQNVADENITSSPILETSNKNEKPCTVSTIDLGEVLEKTHPSICNNKQEKCSMTWFRNGKYCQNSSTLENCQNEDQFFCNQSKTCLPIGKKYQNFLSFALCIKWLQAKCVMELSIVSKVKMKPLKHAKILFPKKPPSNVLKIEQME